MSPDLLTPAQVADLLGVSPITVRRWAQLGKLPAQQTPGGHRRFRRADVEALRDARTNQGTVIRVLIVEDDPQFRRFLEESLMSIDPPIEIHCVDNGFDAGLAVTRFKPTHLLLDLMLPGVDGFSVCREIRANPSTAQICVIAMTGYPSLANEQQIMSAGADLFMAKPIRLRNLLDALQISRSTPDSPS